MAMLTAVELCEVTSNLQISPNFPKIAELLESLTRTS